MKRLDVEFAPIARWRLWWPFALLLTLLAVGGFASIQAWHANVRLTEAQEALSASQLHSRAEKLARAASAPAAPSAPALSSEQLRRRSEVANLAQFDLNGVFAQIESAQVAGIKARAIEADPQTQSSTIEIEAPSLNEVLSYLQALNAGQKRCPWKLDRAVSADGIEVARLHCVQVSSRSG